MLIISGLIAVLVLMNHQMITGFNINPDHYFGSSGGVFFSLLAFLVCIYLYIKNIKSIYKRKKSIFGALFIIIIIFISINQIRNPILLKDHYSLKNEYIETVEWLNENTDPTSVLATTGIRNLILIPALTNLNTLATHSHISASSTEEHLNRHFLNLKLFNVSEYDLRMWMEDNSFNGANNWFFEQQYTKKTGYPEGIPNEIKIKIIDEYNKLSIPEDLSYRLDYVLSTDMDIGNVDENYLRKLGFSKVFNNSIINIYKKQEMS